MLVIQGAAGIGKSTLLRAVYENAAKQQLQTVTTRGNELERDFGFGMVRQLFERRVAHAGEAELGELLAGAAALPPRCLAWAGMSVTRLPFCTACTGSSPI